MPVMSTSEERLDALRHELVRRELDGFIVPSNDEHIGENVAAYARRLAWLTGFQGSSGLAVVLMAEAAIFVDGRYALQARKEVDSRSWSCCSVSQSNFAEWLSERTAHAARIAYDPSLHVKSWVSEVSGALARRGAHLVPAMTNLVDAIWFDQPSRPTAPLRVYPNDAAGQSSAEKRGNIADWLKRKGLDAVVVSSLDSIAWMLNVRGGDVEHTPVALAYCLIHSDETADLFVAVDSLTDAVITHLGSNVRLHPCTAFASYLGTLRKMNVGIDPERSPISIFQLLHAAGAKVTEACDPVQLPKAIKNRVEIAGHKAAQVRDSTALCKFLHWLSVEVPTGMITEISAAAQLRYFRESSGALSDLSFATISAAGPNSAFIHYRASEKTCRPLAPRGLYLVDSGGQYLDGTTDVTRTIAIGVPSKEMRDRFTRVLKGHIALSRVVFPVGTHGGQLDAFARQYLWSAGIDYPHGTGHGVGSYLAVHEGPQRVSRVGDCSAPLMPGMIISNEPGYYKEGEYGIRTENLMLVVERDVCGGEIKMLGFEVLNFAPLDRALIDMSLLTKDEREWIDAYHAEVARVVGPHLEGAAKRWLAQATIPLDVEMYVPN